MVIVLNRVSAFFNCLFNINSAFIVPLKSAHSLYVLHLWFYRLIPQVCQQLNPSVSSKVNNLPLLFTAYSSSFFLYVLIWKVTPVATWGLIA